MRSLLYRAISFLLAYGCLALLAACGAGGEALEPAHTLKPTTGVGQQFLHQSAQLLASAQTLHGLFDVSISGPLVKGELESEIWRLAPNKSRSLVQKSTLSQFTASQLEVDDGRQIWQYDPAKKRAYTGPVSATSSTSAPIFDAGRGSGVQQLIFTIVENIFEHSAATLVSTTASTAAGRPVYTIHVSPLSQTGGNVAANLNYDGTITLDKQTRLPVVLSLTMQGLGQVKLTMINLELNSALDPALFTFTPPAGTSVLPFPNSTVGSDGNLLTLQQAEQQAGYHLLSIPSSQTAYRLRNVDALGAPGSRIYTLTYAFDNQVFTVSESKVLANLPVSGQPVSLHGTSATLVSIGSASTLSWTERGVGIQVSGLLSEGQIEAVAGLLA